MSPIGVSIRGVDAVTAKFDQALPAAVDAGRLRGMQAAAIVTRNALFLAMSGTAIPVPFWGFRSPAGPVLAARTGHTRSALSPGRVWVVGETVFAAVEHAEPHVSALETGETIRPTSGQFLRIPTQNALTSSGADRYAGMSIRAIPGARLIRTKRGTLWAIREVGHGTGARTEFLYLLVRSVKLPEKRLFRSVRDALAPKLSGVVGAEVVIAVRQAA